MGDVEPDPEDNAFIRALPPSLDVRGWFAKLRVQPRRNDSDRLLPHHMRRERVVRLRRYFKPSTKHARFAEQLRLMVKEGYVGRKSDAHSRDARMLELASAGEGNVLLAPSRPFGLDNRAGSAGFFGFAGMGKSLMVEHALSQFERRVPQDGATQIVWLKLDCPADGSLRELCVKFFREVDEVLGRPFYSKLCAGHTANEDTMLVDMRRVAAMHALGVLVIDEIQHLPSDGADEHRLLTFLVNLVNDIGVPVLFVGTMKAKEVVGRSDTLSRRMVGLGGAEWDRLKARGDGLKGEWETFLEDLWTYQWTDTPSDLTDDIRQALWDETQGIVDLLVKLFCLVQMRLILTGEGLSLQMEETPPEIITADKIREVARDELGAVQPMLMALRHGRDSEARRFGDYSKTQRALDEKIVGLVMPEIPVEAPAVADDVAGPPDGDSVAEQVAADEQVVVSALVRQGHDEKAVRSAIRRAKATLGDRPAFLPALLPAAMAEIERPPPVPVRVVANDLSEERLVDGDLRAIARGAASSGRTVYEALCADGLAGPAASSRVA